MSANQQSSMPETLRTMVYGQTRTFIDIMKVMNDDQPIMDIEELNNRLIEYFYKHVRYFGADVTGFACQLLRNWNRTGENDNGINLSDLEEALLDNTGMKYFARTNADEVYCRYCVAKLIHYIELLNEFRRYSSWQEIETDLHETLPDVSCGGVHDFFLVSQFMLSDTLREIEFHWEDVSENKQLSNEKLEEVFFKDFQKMIDTYGMDGTIRKAYTYQGCHPDWLIPESVVGPFLFKTEDGGYEVRCGPHPMSADTFELRYAIRLLRQCKEYREVGSFYVPIRDFTLPVYHHYRGKIHFKTPDEKASFVHDLLRDCNRN